MAVASQTLGAGWLNLERELQCFICTELLFQPLTLIDCLHTFCGACLKEWFNHQHKKATHSRSSSTANPYTCPTCRAMVKDARHDARITTLLDMFLTANPSRSRTAEEQADMSQIYTPGDDILPKVESRRRDRRGRRDEEEAEAQERRLIEEARQRSLRDLDGRDSGHDRLAIPNGARASSRSRERDERRDRRRDQERAGRRRRAEAAGEAHAQEQENQSARTAEVVSLSPPSTSLRHPEAVEARQRDRTIAHQSSLVSLMSASESGTGTGDSLSEARIMQEILAEGLLEGINVDELTEQEQDELSERIADAYRQRHQTRGQPSTRQDPRVVPSDTTGPTFVNLPETTNTNSQPRSRSHQPGDGRSRDVSSEHRRPPASRPHLLEVVDADAGSGQSTAHRRRSSDQNRRQTSPSRSSNRTDPIESSRSLATRSATDLSFQTATRPSRPTERQRVLSDARRTNTDPQSQVRASDIWRQGGRGISSNRPMEPSAPALPTRPLISEPGNPTQSRDATVASPDVLNGDSITHLSDSTSPPLAVTSQSAVPAPLQHLTNFEEPSISCDRCSRPNIQYELYKHCAPCSMDLCLRCYRAGRGCNHWFGFGHAALAKFEASQPSSRSSQLMELPHVLVGRRYLEPHANSVQLHGEDVLQITTTSNPAERLEEGNFCDRCHSFANACFWSCEYCNEGEWGFCNDCVNRHQCCVHPLLPLAHRSFARQSSSLQRHLGYDPHTGTTALTPSDLHASIIVTPTQSRPSTANSATERHNDHPDYVPLRITTHCDICAQAIDASQSRFHCPSHPSPTLQQPSKTGDYDICESCYFNLVKKGRIKREQGPAGWRKCLSGQRMVVIGFETDSYEQQRRVIINDLVGGHRLTEEDMLAWRATTSQASSSGDPAQSPPATGRWTWREDSSGKRTTRTRSATLTSPSNKFPPDGGFGKTYVALWSYYPEDGEDGKGELLFPKGAEICEVEEINEEWNFGVYMGEKGLFPAQYTRVMES